MPPPSLAHTLRPRHVAMISFGGIIGAGLFVASSTAILQAGPAVLISYALSGTLIFLIMRMLGEMAVARPGRGSFASYAALGLGPWAGFLTGWLYWYFWVVTVGVETIAGARLLHDWIAAPIWLIGLVLIAAMTVTNLFSVRSYAEFEFWFASLKVAAIAIFIVLGLGYILGFGPGPAAALGTLTGHGGLFPHGLSAAFATVPVVIFSMMGSEVATIAAAETADPAGNVARAGRTVSFRILIFYVLAIAVIVSILPWNGVAQGKSPFTQTLAAMHIPGGATVMSVVAITAVLSCLNSGLYITSRMLYELASRGEAPRTFAAISGRQVPRHGILFGTAAGFIAALAEIVWPDSVFPFLVNTSGATILYIYLIIAVSEYAFRARLERDGERVALRMWLYPWLSLATAAAIVAILASMAILPGLLLQLLLSTAAGAAVLAAYAIHRATHRQPLAAE